MSFIIYFKTIYRTYFLLKICEYVQKCLNKYFIVDDLPLSNDADICLSKKKDIKCLKTKINKLLINYGKINDTMVDESLNVYLFNSQSILFGFEKKYLKYQAISLINCVKLNELNSEQIVAMFTEIVHALHDYYQTNKNVFGLKCLENNFIKTDKNRGLLWENTYFIVNYFNVFFRKLKIY